MIHLKNRKSTRRGTPGLQGAPPASPGGFRQLQTPDRIGTSGAGPAGRIDAGSEAAPYNRRPGKSSRSGARGDIQLRVGQRNGAARRQIDVHLEKEGLSRVPAEDMQFDPLEHEAIAVEDVDGVSQGRVLAVHQVGYRFNGRLLRPAQVSVAK